MGKKCSIEGCKSGTSDDYNEKIRHNIRKTSVFQVPKNPQKRRLWNAAMNRQFTDGDCVCEWHFPASDIKGEDVVSLPDGTTFSSPLEKRRLKPNAVPTLITRNQENEDPQNNLSNNIDVQSIEDSQQLNDMILDLQEPASEIEIEEVQEAPSTSSLEARMKEENAEELRLSDEELSYHELSNARFTGRLLQSSNNDIVDKDVKEDHSQLHFTIDELIDHVTETPLPRSWGWSENPDDDDGLLLHQFDPVTRQNKIIIEVHHDLSTTLCTNDNEVRIHIERPVTSINRFNKVLQKATRVVACSGTGFEVERRSKCCEGFIPPDAAFLRRQRMPRCRACRLRRKELQARDCRRAKRIDILELIV